MKSDLRAWIAFMLTLTFCVCVVLTFVAWFIGGPGSAGETAINKMAELLIYVLGIVSGYLLGHTGKKDDSAAPNP